MRLADVKEMVRQSYYGTDLYMLGEGLVGKSYLQNKMYINKNKHFNWQM